MEEAMRQTQQLDRAGKKRLIHVAAWFLLSGAFLFFCAGRLDWPEAWIYLGSGIVVALVMGTIVVRKNPAAINARGRRSPKTKGWDKLIVSIMAPTPILLLALAGLDARYGWSSVPLWLKVLLFFAAMLPGMLLPYLAMLSNPFLAMTVRVEEERGHRVATTGPYRFVRHPMYTGIILSWIAGPVFLGSWGALIPGGFGIMVLIVRTFMEDRTLQSELAGYADYAVRVRYRLVPGMW